MNYELRITVKTPFEHSLLRTLLKATPPKDAAETVRKAGTAQREFRKERQCTRAPARELPPVEANLSGRLSMGTLFLVHSFG